MQQRDDAAAPGTPTPQGVDLPEPPAPAPALAPAPAPAPAPAEVTHFAAMMNHIGGVMYVRSVDGGRLLLVNTAFEELVGRPAADICGRTGHELFPAEVADEHLANDREVLARDGMLTRTETATGRDGVPRTFVSHKFPLRDPSGRPYAVAGISIDVTDSEAERRSVHASWLDTEARFRAVFDHAPIGQIYSDLGGCVTSVNQPMAAMLGYTPEQMIGRRAVDFVEHSELPRLRLTTMSLLAGETDSVNEVRRFVHRDGRIVPVRLSSALLRNADGEPQWWVSMVTDITDEEHTRAELERAHRVAVHSADRLRLQHAVATAANEASTLVELAPRMLAAVCAHFSWDGGGLVCWPGDAPHAVTLVRHGAPPAELPSTLPPTIVADGSRVVVPVAGRCDQRLAWVFATSSARLDDDRETLQLLAIESRRVIERESAAQMLRDSEARFRAVFDSSPLPMGLTLGDSGTYSTVNDAFCDLLGYSKDELTGASARDLCHPDDRVLTDPAGAAALAAPDGRHTFELRLVRADGGVVITNVTLAWMDGPDGTRQLLGQFEDITARRTVEEVLHRQAHHDGLTGLANRVNLGEVLADKAAAGAACAVMFIDLDGFKLINDTRGHDVGDEVLTTVANRLRAAVRPTDLVVRFGGDEFVVLCDAVPGEDHYTARQVAERIEDVLAQPMSTQAGPATITASIGIAAGRVDPALPQELVQRADAAMYEAKRLGKDRCEVYDVRLHERARQHQRTEAALRNALAEDRFTVHLQPIVRLSDDTITGFEALVRLVDEDGSLVAPDRFIAVAERSGLIVQMGTWVLHESCRVLSQLRAETGRSLTVAVNIAARQAARHDFADVVRDALEATGLPSEALTLELTESALLEADESTLDQLVRLREQGVLIALDDFGTGYSSLTYLRRFPVGQLKVDRAFVSGMAQDASDRAIVGAIARLAEELGMRWVAEGVETVDQQRELRLLGNGLAQGYLFSRPRPEAEIRALLGLDRLPVLRSA